MKKKEITPYWKSKCGLMEQREVYYQEKQHYIGGERKFITSLFHGVP